MRKFISQLFQLNGSPTYEMKKHVLPWIRGNYGNNKEYIIIQDGAPAHSANITLYWLQDHLKFWSKNIWLPSSPDLNPLDFSIMAKVESVSCKKAHCNIESLKTSVIKALG